MDNNNENDVCENGKQSISLGIRSKHLMTEDVSRQLDLNMTEGRDHGTEIYVKRTGTSHICEYGVWGYDSLHFVQSEEIMDHLEYILNIFESRIDRLQYFLDDESYDVTLRIWFEGGIGVVGFGFVNETFARMMKICKGIYFTLCLATPETGESERLTEPQ
jgi:predicted component of type VI protein secretion system